MAFSDSDVPGTTRDCQSCLDKNVVLLREENLRLTKSIERLRNWLQRIPEDWLNDGGVGVEAGVEATHKVQLGDLHPLLEKAREPGNRVPSGQTTLKQLKHLTAARRPVLQHSDLQHDNELPNEPANLLFMTKDESPCDLDPGIVTQFLDQGPYAITPKTDGEFENVYIKEECDENEMEQGYENVYYKEDTTESEDPLQAKSIQDVTTTLSKKRKYNVMKPNRYTCDQCDHTASTPSKIRLHKEVKHLGFRYSCDECDYSSPSTRKLKEHKEVKHLGIRYPCDKCDFASTTTCNLKKHKNRMHEGIRYPCDKCEYSAGDLGHLSRHRQSKHKWYYENKLFLAVHDSSSS